MITEKRKLFLFPRFSRLCFDLGCLLLFRQPPMSSYTAADLLHQKKTQPPKMQLHMPPPYPRPHQVTPAACCRAKSHVAQ